MATDQKTPPDRKKNIKPPTPDRQKKVKPPTPDLADQPDDNVDQDGNCTIPAYGEAVGPNSGAPCDDGRAGGK